jgi:hypothetical protein
LKITGILNFTYFSDDMRQTEFYQKSLIILHGYKPAMAMLGEPLEAKRLDLAGGGPNKIDRVKGTAEVCTFLCIIT